MKYLLLLCVGVVGLTALLVSSSKSDPVAFPAATSPIASSTAATTTSSAEKPAIAAKPQPESVKKAQPSEKPAVKKPSTPVSELGKTPTKQTEIVPVPSETPKTEPSVASPVQAGPGSEPVLSLPSLTLKIHALINAERQAAGFAALSFDAALAAIATGHSRDMGTRNFFAHANPDGLNFSERYAQAGYTCEVQVGNTIYGGGENLFQNNRYDSVTITNGVRSYAWNTEAEIAASTVAGWMNSPGHRKNILTSYFKAEGIGIFIAADDRIYITQNFC